MVKLIQIDLLVRRRSIKLPRLDLAASISDAKLPPIESNDCISKEFIAFSRLSPSVLILAVTPQADGTGQGLNYLR